MNRRQNKLGWIVAIAALIIVNLLASLVHFRFDLTEEKRYSLTKTTDDLVKSLDDDLVIDVFLKGEFPSEFRKLSNATGEFLSLLKESNPARIQYRFIDPTDEVSTGKRWSDSLQAMGISPINLSVQVKSGEENKIAFPYALVHYNGQSAFVNLFQTSKRVNSPAELNNAEAMMEYQFDKAINSLMHPTKPLVGYAVGNGEPIGAESYDLSQVVGANYNLVMFNLLQQPAIPDTIKALLVVKPSIPFTDAQKLKIDQYIMRGGKVVWFIDNLFAEQDSLSFKSQLIAYDRNLNIQDMLFRYGVRINPDLVMDLQCDFLPFAVGGNASNPQYEFLHWNYYPLFETGNNHQINKNIGLVAGRFVNSVDTIEAAGLKKTVLLQSSANSRIINTPALISPNENRNAPEDPLFKQKGIPAAVLVEGQFTSFYKSRLSGAQRDSLAAYGGFKESSDEGGKMIVVGDGDVVLNDVSAKDGPLPMGMNLFTVGSQYEYQFANRDFLLNCLEYMTSTSNMIEARNKEIVLRLLDNRKVEEQKTKWQFINIALPVFIIIIFGLIYHQVRNRRYATPRS